MRAPFLTAGTLNFIRNICGAANGLIATHILREADIEKNDFPVSGSSMPPGTNFSFMHMSWSNLKFRHPASKLTLRDKHLA